MARHRLTHTGERPFKCEYSECGKAFAEKSTLHVHERTHTGERPFKCEYPECEWAFKTSSALGAHEKRHTGERPYKCEHPGCDGAFGVRSNLRAHERSVHGASSARADVTNSSSPVTIQSAASNEAPSDVASDVVGMDVELSSAIEETQAVGPVESTSVIGGTAVSRSVDDDDVPLSVLLSGLKRLRGDGAGSDSPAGSESVQVKSEDGGFVPFGDGVLLAQVAKMTELMDEPVPNCLRLCQAMVNFLVSGRPVEGPVESTEAPFEDFPENIVETTQVVGLKREDGAVKRRRLTWLQHESVSISDRAGSLARLLPHPTIGFIESDQSQLGAVVDLEDYECVPVRVHVGELDDFIVRQLGFGADSVVGLVTMSRVNEHAYFYSHVVTFYAYRDPAMQRNVIRYIDPQNRNIPMSANIWDHAEFLTSFNQQVHGDIFAPILDVFTLQRQKR